MSVNQISVFQAKFRIATSCYANTQFYMTPEGSCNYSFFCCPTFQALLVPVQVAVACMSLVKEKVEHCNTKKEK